MNNFDNFVNKILNEVMDSDSSYSDYIQSTNRNSSINSSIYSFWIDDFESHRTEINLIKISDDVRGILLAKTNLDQYYKILDELTEQSINKSKDILDSFGINLVERIGEVKELDDLEELKSTKNWICYETPSLDQLIFVERSSNYSEESTIEEIEREIEKMAEDDDWPEF